MRGNLRESEVFSGDKAELREEPENLPDPDVIAQEIVEDLEAALEQFREIAVDLGGEGHSGDTIRMLLPDRHLAGRPFQEIAVRR